MSPQDSHDAAGVQAVLDTPTHYAASFTSRYRALARASGPRFSGEVLEVSAFGEIKFAGRQVEKIYVTHGKIHGDLPMTAAPVRSYSTWA